MRYFVLFLAVVCGRVTAAPEVKAIGLAVIFDGSTVRSNAACHEYTALKLASGTYGLSLPNGTKKSGLGQHLVDRIDYRTVDSKALLARMERVAKEYTKAAPILAPRIEKLKVVVEEETAAAEQRRQRAEDIARAVPPATVPSVKLGDKTYKNVRPSSLRNGKLGLMHDEGVFTVPASALSYTFLVQLAKRCPEMAETEEFKALRATFVPAAKIGGKALTGVRLITKEDQRLVLATDSGLETVDRLAVDIMTMAELDSAALRRAALEEKFKGGLAADDAAQAEYYAAVERKNQERRAAAAEEHERLAKEDSTGEKPQGRGRPMWNPSDDEMKAVGIISLGLLLAAVWSGNESGWENDEADRNRQARELDDQIRRNNLEDARRAQKEAEDERTRQYRSAW